MDHARLAPSASRGDHRRRAGFARAAAGSPRLYWELGGAPDGRPLVLIRGLARSMSYWLAFRSHLEATRPVIALDNRGVGRSEAPAPGYSVADMADDVAAVLRAAGHERADVFGISLGGMIAQELALRHPHRVDRLVLAATTPGRRGGRPIDPAALRLLARGVTLPFDDGLRLTSPLVLSEAFLARRPEIVDHWIAIAESEPRPRLGVVGQLLAAARHDAWDRLRWLRAPTLAITGDRDRLIHPENSERLARRIPDARLEAVVGAGHDFCTERPEEAAARVTAFLDA